MPDPVHLGSWVELHEEICRSGRTRRLLVNHRTHMALSLDAEEAEVIRALGTESLVAEDPMHSDLLVELNEGGFLAGDEPELCRRGIRVSLSDFDVRWHGADGFVQALYRRGARCLFHPIAVVAQIVLGLLGAAAVCVAIFSHAGLHLRVQPAQVPIILGLTVVAVAIHETAHALVVIRYGRSVDAMGFRLLLGAPSFYVESVDALLLTRRQRLIQAAAGPWAEWLVVSVIALWLLHSPDLLISPLLRRFIILNTATIASNLIPFAGLDGSWILGDALGEPDLHQRSRGALTRLITNALEGAPPGPRDTLVGWLQHAQWLGVGCPAGHFCLLLVPALRERHHRTGSFRPHRTDRLGRGDNRSRTAHRPRRWPTNPGCNVCCRSTRPEAQVPA